jgi:formamidopyrimidine-DNA glycosylase
MVGKLGPNALDLSLDEFRVLLQGRRGAIKTFLLDQDRIAGIGNVYVQTPLWRARIHPLRPIPTLTTDEAAALWQVLRDILQGSIGTGGAPFEPNLYAQKGGWDDPYCSTGRRRRLALLTARRWPRYRRAAQGATFVRGARHSEPR